ncbi:uncharacterized protein LOC100182736 [Ciona intestinalis]
MFSVIATRMLTTIWRREVAIPITSIYKYNKQAVSKTENVLSSVFYHRAPVVLQSIETASNKTLQTVAASLPAVVEEKRPNFQSKSRRKLMRKKPVKLQVYKNKEFIEKALVVYNHKPDLMFIPSNLDCCQKSLGFEEKQLLRNTVNYISPNVDNTTNINDNLNKTEEPANDPHQKLRLLYSKLRNEIPMFFEKRGPWHDFSIYTKDIELHTSSKKNPEKLKLFLSGHRSYRFFLWSYRQFNLRYLSQPTLEILGMELDETHHRIEVRWRLSGWNPTTMICNLLLSMPANRRYYDYVSTLYVNKDGDIWRHDVRKIRLITDSIIRRGVEVIKSRSVAAAAAIASKLQTLPFFGYTDKITPSKKTVT